MLGRYKIEDRIGEGAMAEVFRAHDTSIDRTVAIKALRPEFRHHPELTQRFLREASAAGTLSHAHIATIYDVGEADGAAYIAMELVAGRPLDEVLKVQGRMPFERVLELGIQLADALAYAHGRGIVHRDVKPSNILVSPDGRTAKLLDFGVARMGEAGSPAADPARTQIGQVIGTPRYMSPEQALGVAADPRSDLFSLGTVLYEMISGKVAFNGTGLAALALQITQDAPQPLDHAARDCPRGLRFIIEKLLAKKPEKRFADGTALVQALRRELDAVNADHSTQRRGLALKVKIPLALCGATSLALGASMWAVIERQNAALEHMAVVSGSSITAFVTSNAAVLAADNAGLPPERQDWAPLQAFVETAVQDTGVRRLVVEDAAGIVRASNDRSLLGHPYTSEPSEKLIEADAGAHVTTVTDATGGGGFRFVKPIHYAGANFGTVDLVLRRSALDEASAATRRLLIGLSLFIMSVVTLIAWLSASFVSTPLARLQRALADASDGDLSFRLSHRGNDEFTAAFDAFNRLAATIEAREAGVPFPDPGADAATLVVPRQAA